MRGNVPQSPANVIRRSQLYPVGRVSEDQVVLIQRTDHALILWPVAQEFLAENLPMNPAMMTWFSDLMWPKPNFLVIQCSGRRTATVSEPYPKNLSRGCNNPSVRVRITSITVSCLCVKNWARTNDMVFSSIMAEGTLPQDSDFLVEISLTFSLLRHVT